MKHKLLDQPRINFIFRFSPMHKGWINFAVKRPNHSPAITLLR